MIRLRSVQAQELFLVLHETANRPEHLNYQYMTGALRGALERRVFGPVLSAQGERRARQMGSRLRGAGVALIVTEESAVTVETVRCIVERGAARDRPEISFDSRVCESDLSYLTRERFDHLCDLERRGDPNACMRDWIASCPDAFERLVSRHVELWNELVAKREPAKKALVLHVEGLLLLTALALGLSQEHLVRLVIPRGCPVHIRLWPDRDPTVSFGDDRYWRTAPKSVFGGYE